ncbi:hypothetical protein DDZ15_04905 [Rhodohalobacter mucosus]|uniref:Uncharacterized protein n=1 Tax=Rhodohalobacter mucosus TaxID=2079485 RepID=A0A316TW53_9BACT|nr:hypothetical protein DDZ15_04905 [Rhodohalobacter mucosus]
MFVSTATVTAQQSDYQIQQEFRSEYNTLSERIENAATPDELIELSLDIDEFEANYSEYASIIDAALYPETMNDRISSLRSRYSVNLDNLRALQESDQRIRELMGQVDEFRNQLATMDEEVADLKEQIDRASANERQQAALIRQYRQNIEQRDEFVSDFLQDLLQRYETMDSATQTDVASAAEQMDSNPVDVLKNIISEYTQNADQDSELSAPDFVRMRAQHGYFLNVWDTIGERLASTFSPDNPVEARQEVTDMLSAWQASIDNKLWNALSTEFNQNGIELSPFTSPESFNSSLNSYVDEAMNISMESSSEENYEIYRNFSSYWNNTVKGQWGELLINGNILSAEDMAAIDVKLNTWGENAVPSSNLMFILFLVSLAVIIGLIVLLVTKKG